MATLTLNTDCPTTQARPEWQTILAEAVRSPVELCHRLGLDPALTAQAEGATRDFAVLVPQPFLARIRPGDPNDPLLRQVLPHPAEQVSTPGYEADPLGESEAAGHSRLLQKYQGRLLIVTTGACAVHCRFCFRRHFPYDSACCGRNMWTTTLQRLAANRSISEVILSGGDPLTLSDADLAEVASSLSQIPHLRRIRIHTRLPVVIPQRVTEDLLAILRRGRLSSLVVVHVNHPAEIDADVARALSLLVDAGVPVLSQTVLLHGVNDQTEVLAELFERLADLRVIPYYLHQLDAVAGAAHFAVPVAKGIALVAELRNRLPGYAVPRYVRETRGGRSKEILA